MNFSICISIHKIKALDQNFGCLVNMLNCIDEALGVLAKKLSVTTPVILILLWWCWQTPSTYLEQHPNKTFPIV